jgi:hypothetical protein
MPSADTHLETLAGDFRKTINRHGHAFQNAIIRRADELYRTRRSSWVFNAAEIPAEVRGQGTRIDFLLHQNSWNNRGPTRFLVAECKRANPALSNWCFARTKYIHRGLDEDYRPLIEHVRFDGQEFTSQTQGLGSSKSIFNLAYEVRSDNKGEGAPGRGAIEEACGQLLRGVNGLVHLLRDASHLLSLNHPTPLVPVVFTTANLWTTEADISEADLTSGELAAELTVQPAEWIWYRYHMSPGLRHDIPAVGIEHELGELVERWFTRTVAIVSPAGIDSFLSASL